MGLENMFVGAKHDRSEYKIIINNLYAVMLRPLQKPDARKCDRKLTILFYLFSWSYAHDSAYFDRRSQSFTSC
jgi:hypothetical protein